VSLAGGSKVTGQLIRLTAPSVTGEFGVSLAGQTYDNSPDGNPIGNWTEESVAPDVVDGNSLYSFNVAQLSAIMMQIQLADDWKQTGFKPTVRVE